MAKADKKTAAGKKQIIILAQGGVLAFASSLLLIFLFSFAISKGWLQLDAALKLAAAACAVGGFFSSLFTVKRIGSKSLPIGLAVGLLQFILFLFLGLLTAERMTPGMDQLPLLASCLCSGGLAGLLAKKGKKKRRV